jgi:hypothetical protein
MAGLMREGAEAVLIGALIAACGAAIVVVGVSFGISLVVEVTRACRK